MFGKKEEIKDKTKRLTAKEMLKSLKKRILAFGQELSDSCFLLNGLLDEAEKIKRRSQKDAQKRKEKNKNDPYYQKAWQMVKEGIESDEKYGEKKGSNGCRKGKPLSGVDSNAKTTREEIDIFSL